MRATPYCVCLSAAPDPRTARRIARALVEERLVACVSLIPGGVSLFWWKGRVVRESETLVLMKTRASRLPLLQRRLRAAHPYEVPELLVLPVRSGMPAYLRWLAAETQASKKKGR